MANMEKLSWLTDIVGNEADCSAGYCAACCVLPAIEDEGFHKPPRTPCKHLNQEILLCEEWPHPPCNRKSWTCRENVNKDADPHIYRAELIQQRDENLKTRLAIKKSKLKLK